MAPCLARNCEKRRDLAVVMETRDSLPEAVKGGILAMPRAAMKRPLWGERDHLATWRPMGPG